MATAIRGRLIQMSTKLPLQGITVEAVNVATGAPAATSATTDTYGFYSLTGLTDAVYFAKPLVPGEDWSIQPDTNVIFGGDLYVPDNTTTPRVQITTNTHGGFAILGSGDTYDDSTGNGTYQVLFDYAKSPVGMYFQNGNAYIGSAGIVIQNNAYLQITNNASGASLTYGIRADSTITGTGSFYSLFGFPIKSGTSAVSDLIAVYARPEYAASGTAGTLTNSIGLFSQMSQQGSAGGAITNSYGVQITAPYTLPTVTNNYGLFINSLSGGATNRGIVISLNAAASDYALHISGGAQSVHAGNVRIGSTTAPTVALDVTGAILGSSTISTTLGLTNGSVAVDTPSSSPGLILRADSATKQRADILRTTTALIFRVRDSNAAATNASLTITDGTGDVAGAVMAGAALASAGDLTVGDTTASADKNIRIPDNSGNADRVLARVTSGNHVYVGDIDNNGGDLNLRAGGSTRIQLVSGGAITITDGVNIALNTTTGTKIGTATTQKLGFYNATPVVRPSAYTQTYSAADKTHANDGSADFPAGGTGTAAGGWDTAANRNLAITRFNALRVTVTDLKQLVNAVIDDLQALGLVG